MSDNNGLPGEIGVPLDTPDSHKLKADAGLPHLPTQLTYECRLAISGQGPLAYTWEDKPHRLVYTLCREIERIAALTPADEIEKLRAALRVAMDAVEHWASYASPYAQEKHDLAGDLQKLRAALGEKDNAKV
jgi:hypothetical protein